MGGADATELLRALRRDRPPLRRRPTGAPTDTRAAQLRASRKAKRKAVKRARY